MRRLDLTEVQRVELEQAYKSSPDRRLRERCQALLMTARSKSREEVAHDLLTSPRSVQRWVQTYLKRGLAGLERKKAQGRSERIPAELSEEILGWAKQGRSGCGLSRANWRYEELRNHLFQHKGT